MLTIHDTITPLEPLFTQKYKPRDLLEIARPILMEPSDRLTQLKGNLYALREHGFDVAEAALRDGYDCGMQQQGFGLFNPTRRIEASAWVFAQYHAEGILERLRDTISDLLAHLPGITDLEIALFPADPANRTLMIHNHGLSVCGLRPGLLMILLWPSAGNLARLRAVLARALVYQAHTASGGTLHTLRDWLTVEARAQAFVTAQTDGDWRTAFQAPAAWATTLDGIAQTYYALDSYDEMLVNVYGQLIPVGAARPPAPVMLDADERAYTVDVLREALDTDDTTTIAACLYGDAIITEQGYPGVGLSPFAGFACAADLVADVAVAEDGHRQPDQPD